MAHFNYGITRRNFLRVTGATLATASLAPFAQAEMNDTKRLNMIVILSDDMGYSDLGCYGGEINTPNLDGLAKSGVRFTQFYNTARCCPTRSSLLTGLYPHQAGVGYMTDMLHYSKIRMINEWYQGDLRKDCITLGEMMKLAGYATYAVGKWHVTKYRDGVDNHNWPLQRGFDRYYGIIGGAANYFDPEELVRGNKYLKAESDPDYQSEEYYLTTAISNHAAQYIETHTRQQSNKPFFMYLAYSAAHWPLHALPKDIARYKGKYDQGYDPIRKARFERAKELGVIQDHWDLSDQWGDWDNMPFKEWEARCMEVYAAQVDSMDQGIGQVIKALKNNGQFENTLILYLQDNGACAEEIQGNRLDLQEAPPMPGAKDTWQSYGEAWANVSNTPFRYYKHFVHEGGIATPLIAHWPEGIKRKGEIERQPGHLIDIMATCVDLSGAKYPKEYNGETIQPMEGCSLVPAFKGKEIQREAIFFEHESNRAIRKGKWKLVAKGANGEWELYNLERDRTEVHNLAKKYPAKTREMIKLWEEWAERTHAIPWPWAPAYGEDLIYEYSQGVSLDRYSAPDIGGREVLIEAAIEHNGADGIIYAQGGLLHGLALYIDQSKPTVAVRCDGNLHTITAKKQLKTGTLELSARLERSGKVTIMANGEVIGRGNASGPVSKTPLDGMQIGSDQNDPVGDYKGPFTYSGMIKKVVLSCDPES